MQQETYYKNKQIFIDNYEKLKTEYTLSIPIDLLMAGIKIKSSKNTNRKIFFKLLSYDLGIKGTLLNSSVETYNRWETYRGEKISKISQQILRNMFKFEEQYDKMLNYVT